MKHDSVVAGPRGFPRLETYRAIKLVVFDVHGVLTDGRIFLSDDGAEIKSFHASDGIGTTLLHAAHIDIGIITGRASPASPAVPRS